MKVQLDQIYQRFADDPDFEVVIRQAREIVSDDALAELIEADGRWRIERGRAVDFERYLEAVPDLPARPDALDAALEVVLRACSGSSRVTEESIRDMTSRYPALSNAIREAAALNAALWSTTGLRNRVIPRPAKAMPCEFGPPASDGRRRYVLREFIGQGSFGQVYRAEDRQLSEEGHAAEVAIKILSAIERTEHDRHRMIDEATKARRINHPNVVQVLDRGVMDDDEEYIVYEYVGGGDLGDVATKSLPMRPDDAAAMLAQIARGVHAAHAAGVIHCDLKPSNIMLTEAGQPKVADFGIAVRLGEERRSAMSGSAYARGPIGNIAFISPEQFRGDESGFSVPSDVYALGGILFYLLTGEHPNGSSREEIAATHDESTSATAEHRDRVANALRNLDHDLGAICLRALADRPSKRHDSAAALAEDLERWRRREPITWQRPSPFRRLTLWARRKPALALASAALLTVVIAGAAIASHFARKAEHNAIEARIAQLQVDEDARIKALQLQLAGKVATSLRDVGRDERFLTDMLMQAWVYEFLYGPTVLGTPELARQMWSGRVAAVRQMLAERSAQGLDDTIDSLMWSSALAFWLVSDHDYVESVPLLDDNIQRWSRRTRTDDPWLEQLGVIRQCAEVNRLCDPAVREGDQHSRQSQLQTLASALEQSAAAVEAARPRSPLHYLVLNRLADLYDPDALNDPDRAASLRRHVRVTLEETQTKHSGASKALQETNQAIEGGAAPAGTSLP